jgi:uncharacterized Zn finger protein (UPF0148 family)
VRVECESCKQLVAASFAIRDGAIEATCSACHATMKPIPPATPSVAVLEVCPKCGTTRKGDVACPSCGLTADRMAAFEQTRDGNVPEAVREAWQRVLVGWDDPVPHEELFRLVTKHQSFAWAAARYRDAGRAHKTDTIAERQLDRVRRAAEVTLFVSGTPRADAPSAKPYRSTIAILGVLVVAIAMGLVYAMVFHTDHGDAPATHTRASH